MALLSDDYVINTNAEILVTYIVWINTPLAIASSIYVYLMATKTEDLQPVAHS